MSEKQRNRQQRSGHPGPGRGGPGAMMPGEKAKDFKGTMRNLMDYLKGYMPAIITCLILAVASVVLSVAGPKILGGATDKLFEGVMAMIAGTGSIDLNAIARILIFLGIIYLASALLQYGNSFILNTVANRIGYKMRTEISQKINRLPLSYFDRVSHGDVLSRITNDVDTLTQSLNQSLPQVITSATSVLGALVMMLTINVWMTLITLLIIPLSVIVVTQVVKRSQPFYQKQQKYLGEANGQVEEMYGGHLVVKAFNREEETGKAFNDVNERLYKSAWKSQFFGGIMMPLMNFVGNFGYVLVCVMGGFFTLSGSISVGDIQAFIQYVRNFTQPITQIANASNVMQQTAAAAERVFEFLNEAEEAPDTEQPVSADEVDGSVFFAHVNFGYLPEKTIINDFSAMVEPGQQVAIVGPTGAGKTTMVKLLMRFYDVNDGAILLGGYDVKQFRRGELRGMFGMVLQDTWLYNDTIMENIRYGRLDATDEEVIEAAKAAQADRFIRTLPDGYNMLLNEEASNISAGQKQLLTIARTILSEPKMMILDEATSSVDTRTEIAIQKAMRRLMKNRTSFVIAHRLSTIRDADMILVMRDGDVVETGTHTELLEKGGFYAQLYNSQFESGITA
ncbi:ABC transporter ATP-binding protein/permease [Ruminococcaceae bacterium OttesenSCG-928-D13]|nr:ABC transporter ATP-binding protein/permease [Ruminococcaceae bacterium OttesenSCG-928-D13]